MHFALLLPNQAHHVEQHPYSPNSYTVTSLEKGCSSLIIFHLYSIFYINFIYIIYNEAFAMGKHLQWGSKLRHFLLSSKIRNPVRKFKSTHSPIKIQTPCCGGKKRKDCGGARVNSSLHQLRKEKKRLRRRVNTPYIN